LKAFNRFKQLAGTKGYVSVADLRPIIEEIPISEEVLATFCGSSTPSGDPTEVDFREMLNVVVSMRQEEEGVTSLMQYKILFKMYDQDGDGVIGQEELTALLFEISK
jgi:Ca2+-binding EF-hand superfamily protein